MHTTEKELLEITGYKPQRKFSNRQDYLGSVLNSVLKLSDEEFDNLSDEAAEWTNAAVQAKNARNQDLPDFNEIEPDEGEEGDSDEAETNNADEAGNEASTDEVENSEDENQTSDSENEIETEENEPKSKIETVKSKTSKPKKAVKKAALKKEAADEEDVILDKWGAMEGSKNSRALALFEKGATTKEIKDKLGGTYYNILKKMTEKGHKVEKEGSLIKLTHKNELGK